MNDNVNWLKKKLIEKLRKDNEALKHELQLNSSHEKMLNNGRLTSQLAKMHEKIDMYKKIMKLISNLWIYTLVLHEHRNDHT